MNLKTKLTKLELKILEDIVGPDVKAYFIPTKYGALLSLLRKLNIISIHDETCLSVDYVQRRSSLRSRKENQIWTRFYEKEQDRIKIGDLPPHKKRKATQKPKL